MASMRAAFQATQNGMSVYRAARQYKVPESTLRDRTLGLIDENAKLGTSTLLSESEEQGLAEHVNYTASIGYGYTKPEVIQIANNYAISVGKKTESDPTFSDSWFYQFLKRSGNLQVVKPRKLAIVRAKSLSKETVSKYYDELDNILTSNGLHDKPENIYNMDETNIPLEHNPPKVVCSKRSNPQTITSTKDQNVTLIGCGNAQGIFYHPIIFFLGRDGTHCSLKILVLGHLEKCQIVVGQIPSLLRTTYRTTFLDMLTQVQGVTQCWYCLMDINHM